LAEGAILKLIETAGGISDFLDVEWVTTEIMSEAKSVNLSQADLEVLDRRQSRPVPDDRERR